MYVVKECYDCPLGRERNKIVNGRSYIRRSERDGGGDGENNERILLIGEAPGQKEDETGLPFQGQSGDLLDRVLRKADVSVNITNCIRCRPPNNRNPSALELSKCRPHLNAEIEELDPKAIIVLGRVPLDNMMPTLPSKTMLHWMSRSPMAYYRADGTTTPLYVRYHPSYILRNRSQMDDYIKEFVDLLREIDDE